MAVTRTDVTRDLSQHPYPINSGHMLYRAVRVDNSAAEASSVVDFANYGLGQVLVATCYDRTAAAQIAGTISALTTVTSAGHAAGNDVTIFAWGTKQTLANLS